MAADSQSSPLVRVALVVVVALALYLLAFFPAMSYGARHSKSNPLAWASPWLRLPSPVYVRLLDIWMRLDAVGRANFLNAYADSRVHLPTDPYP